MILIVGPTAVGKTELSLQLAERIKGEIVSCDSRQFYRGMDIGTAKPTSAEMRRVPHHLIDVANPDETWSLAIFQARARQAIAEIHARGKYAILVGGTGQYVRALTEGWQPPQVEPDPRLRVVLEKLAAENGKNWLHEKLALLDPVSGQNIDVRNLRRTIRALEVILTTGRLFSDQRLQGQPSFPVLTIGLIRPRADLYSRIDARIETMFKNGLLREVEALLAAGYSSELPSMSGIGYRECCLVLRGQLSEEEAKMLMKRATRAFVRRQSNWFKESDPRIHWFDAGSDGLLDQVANFVEANVRAG
ncbi:MAG TPA: tRNA (adenosine(37)-N6)-dimethylallyltransferase MiaA [Anaerolineales bacterium]